MKYLAMSLAAAAVFAACHKPTIKEVDPTRKFLLELRFNDSDIRKASRDFVDKVMMKLDAIKRDMPEPIIVFDKIENKTDEHIDQLETISDRVLTDLLDTGEFKIVDKRARESLNAELDEQHKSGKYLDESKMKTGSRIASNYFLRGIIYSESQESKEMVVKSYFIRLNLVNIESGLTIAQSLSEIKKVEEK